MEKSDARVTRYKFFAPCPLGVEDLAASEIASLGGRAVRMTKAGVGFEGDLETALRVCLWSRTASRVLLPLTSFEAASAKQLYEGVLEVPWEQHIEPHTTLSVSVNVSSARFAHTGFVALKTKDAIVDRQREVFGARSVIDPRSADLRVDVLVREDEVTVSLDLSGDSLDHRGYRLRSGPAPLRETVAAAVLLRAGWPELAALGAPLLDPMCGTGTLLIEGALIAADIAPGLLRPRFGFEAWKSFPREVWRALKEEAKQRATVGLLKIPVIVGGDHDPVSVEAARRNVAAAGLASRVLVHATDLSHWGSTAPIPRPPDEAPGLMVLNPPYGHRMGAKADLFALYERLGHLLGEVLGGYRAAVLVGDEDLGHALGLRATKVHHLYNGKLRCLLLHFDARGTFAVRAASRSVDSEVEEFRNRLVKLLRHRGRLARRQGITCFRLYDRDLPNFNLVVDVYDDCAVLQEYVPPPDVDPARASKRLRTAAKVVREVLELPEGSLFIRRRQSSRNQTGTSDGESRLAQMAGNKTKRTVEREVSEGGLRFLVNLSDYLDTGLFLDHRITRSLIREWAGGRRFLNLFCYTGAATVYAAAGGALSTTSVDLSQTYLEWAARNMALNGYKVELKKGGRPGSGPHVLVRADCLSWLELQASRDSSFDLVFVDVPTFSNSKAMHGTFDVQRDYVALLTLVAKVLAPGGRILFSLNRRRFRFDAEAVRSATGLEPRDITKRTIPWDFARSPLVHRVFVLE